MSANEPSRGLPEVTNDPLALSPPFAFEGLSARIFPLRANLVAMQRLCDSYLNFIPESVGRFRVMSSYAYLMMLDYGKLSELISNVGWFAQKEVFFCFPVQWFKVQDGRWVFHDWAIVTPYIYVDDDLSVPVGRTVYGWPKTLARLTPTLSEWMDDARAPVNAATLSTMVFPELYEGRRLEQRVLLEVDRVPPTSYLQFPPNTQGPLAPWVIASNFAQNMVGMSRDMWGVMRGLGAYPSFPGGNPLNYSAMTELLLRSLSPEGGGLIANTLNFKQFRKAGAPHEFCYQGLTNGRMKTTSLKNAGLLGEEYVLAGDLSGGYRIRLHEWPSLPIARTLGIEVERRRKGDGGPDVAEIAPVMPFWYKVDMEYYQGVNVVWRTDDREGWRDESGDLIPGQEKKVKTPAPVDRLFNTTIGSSVDALAGPFQFGGTTIRVLPLLAMKKTLEAFLQEYVNKLLPAPEHPDDEKDNVRLRVWAPSREAAVDLPQLNDVPGDPFAHVYLTASSFGTVTSESNNIGDWAKYEVSFLVPVKWERRAKGEKEWKIEGVGLLPAYALVDDTTAAIARSEVVGIPTTKAVFDRPASRWMSDGGGEPGASQVLLRVNAEVLPALGEGRQSQFQTIIDISEDDAPLNEDDGEDTKAAERDERGVADRWAAILRQELMRKKAIKADNPRLMKNARALALDLLGNRVPFVLYTLKQFRDVVDPTKACFQAVLRVARTLEEVLDVREIDQVLRVRIHDFPTLSLVKSLGLLGKSVHEDVAGRVFTTQAIRPFYLRVTMNESLGERIMSRAGPMEWQFAENRPSSNGGPAKQPGVKSVLQEPTSISVTGFAEKLQDISDPRRVEWLAGKWDPPDLESWNKKSKTKSHAIDGLECPELPEETMESMGKVTRDQALQVIQSIDPQMIIESLLSREWGSWAEDARWLRGLREIEAAYGFTLSGVSDQSVQNSEHAFFRGVYEKLQNRPGQPPVTGACAMMSRLYQFTGHRLEIEADWSVLVELGLAREYGSRVRLETLQTGTSHLGESISSLLKNLEGIAALHEQGAITAAPTPDDEHSRLVELLGLLKRRLLKIVARGEKGGDDDHKELIDELWRLRDALREAVGLARELCELQRRRLVSKLSRGWQKPDFCVNRDMVGSERDRLFPQAESWDDGWYYGAAPSEAGPGPKSEVT